MLQRVRTIALNTYRESVRARLFIGLAIVAAYVITRLATRLYERSIMRTGGRLSYREAFKLGA